MGWYERRLLAACVYYVYHEKCERICEHIDNATIDSGPLLWTFEPAYGDVYCTSPSLSSECTSLPEVRQAPKHGRQHVKDISLKNIESILTESITSENQSDSTKGARNVNTLYTEKVTNN